MTGSKTGESFYPMTTGRDARGLYHSKHLSDRMQKANIQLEDSSIFGAPFAVIQTLTFGGSTEGSSAVRNLAGRLYIQIG